MKIFRRNARYIWLFKYHISLGTVHLILKNRILCSASCLTHLLHELTVGIQKQVQFKVAVKQLLTFLTKNKRASTEKSFLRCGRRHTCVHFPVHFLYLRKSFQWLEILVRTGEVLGNYIFFSLKLGGNFELYPKIFLRSSRGYDIMIGYFKARNFMILYP